MRESRRSFIRKSACVAAAVASAGIAPRASAGLFSRGPKADAWLSLGKLANLPDGKGMPVQTAVRVDNGKTVKVPKLIVFRTGAAVTVMSTRCTHWGCEVKQQGDGSYLCPCHNTTFDKTGAVTKGPAKTALPWYQVRVTEAGNVEVNTSKTVAPPDTAS